MHAETLDDASEVRNQISISISTFLYHICNNCWSDLKRNPDVVEQTLSTRYHTIIIVYHYNQLIIVYLKSQIIIIISSNIFAEVCPLSSSLLLQERSGEVQDEVCVE